MTHKGDVKEQAKDILEETLDREAVIVLGRISEEM
ncbi:MAG: RidA family protein, partial [Chlorobiaceae bacterium]|nr:RidA family protein [Chlorobiaceae bacterium]